MQTPIRTRSWEHVYATLAAPGSATLNQLTALTVHPPSPVERHNSACAAVQKLVVSLDRASRPEVKEFQRRCEEAVVDVLLKGAPPPVGAGPRLLAPAHTLGWMCQLAVHRCLPCGLYLVTIPRPPLPLRRFGA